MSYLILATALSVAAAPAQAGNLTLGGSTETTIKYTPEDNWTGQTYLQIYASTGSSAASISLQWYESTVPFWQSLPALTFQPYSITLTKQGSLWSGGPSITTKLGDLNMFGPNYISGDPYRNQVRGLSIQGLPYGALKIGAYFGWPEYASTPLSPGGTTKSYGTSVNVANFRGLKLDAFGVGRIGQLSLPPIIQAPDGAQKAITLVNPTTMAADQLDLFTRQATKDPYLQWWIYYKIADDGTIMQEVTYPDPAQNLIPKAPSASSNYGFLLAAHGAMVDWVVTHIRPYIGQKVKFIDPYTGLELAASEVGATANYKELVGGLEATYKLAGVDINAKAGRQLRYFGSHGPQVTNFRLITASTQLDVLGKDIASKPLSLSLAYRNIDQDFQPWAASTVTDPSDSNYNYIYHHRDEVGMKLTATTSILPHNPVDVTLETDSFVTKSNPNAPATTVSSLSLATKLGSYSVNTALKTTDMSFSVSKSFTALSLIDSITPTYTLTLPSDGSINQELKLESKMSLGGFKNISTTATYTASRTATGTLSATTALLATYTAPNGLYLEAKLTNPNDTNSRDDTYAKVSYKVTF